MAGVVTVVLGAIAWYLHRFGFGAHEPHNAFLRIRTATPVGDAKAVAEVLGRYTRSWVLAAANEMGDGPADYTFHLQILDMSRNSEMITALQSAEDIVDLDLTLQEQLLEI